MIQYFTKYYNKFKQFGGILMGTGSSGYVVSNPIPVISGPTLINDKTKFLKKTDGETKEMISKNFKLYKDTSVAKFFKNEIDYKIEVGLMYLVETKILLKLPDELKLFFCKRYANGNINYNFLSKQPTIYNKAWIGYTGTKSFEDFLDEFHSEVIIYEKGIPANQVNCLVGLLDLFNLLVFLSKYRIYILDMKLGNSILVDKQLKLIDYSFMNFYNMIYQHYVNSPEPVINFLIYEIYSYEYQCIFNNRREISKIVGITSDGTVIGIEAKMKLDVAQLPIEINELKTHGENKSREIKELIETIKKSPEGKEEQKTQLETKKEEYKKIITSYNSSSEELRLSTDLLPQYKCVKELHDSFIKYLFNLTKKRNINSTYEIEVKLFTYNNSEIKFKFDLRDLESIKSVVSKCFIVVQTELHIKYIERFLTVVDKTISLRHQQLYSYGIMHLRNLLNNHTQFNFALEVEIIKLIIQCLIHYVNEDTIIIPSIFTIQDSCNEIKRKLV